MDVLSASYNDGIIAWYENDGSQGFGAQQIITTEAAGASSVHAGDLDGDGDPDVLSASVGDNRVAWYENDGNGGFGSQNIIVNAAGGPRRIRAADLDGDGDLDALVASWNDARISWYPNMNGQGAFGPRQEVTNFAYQAASAHAADMDGDGDADVVGASLNLGVAWYRNVGGGAFATPPLVDVIGGGRPPHAVTGDLNRDGRLEVVLAQDLDSDVSWVEVDPLGAFGTEQVIDSGARGVQAVQVADMDGDGDLDIVAALEDEDVVTWWENVSLDPLSSDTDGDGLSDSVELEILATDPSDRDTDDDGLNDWYSDEDGDGVSNGREINRWGTDPMNPDSDGDGFPDGQEVEAGTSPISPAYFPGAPVPALGPLALVWLATGVALAAVRQLARHRLRGRG
jgi:hypothetical protein